MVRPASAASISIPDSRGTTGRDGSTRDTKATASPSTSLPTVNLMDPRPLRPPIQRTPPPILAPPSDTSGRSHAKRPGDAEAASTTGPSNPSGLSQPGRHRGQRSLDRLDQSTGGLRRELDGDSRRGPLGGINEIDIESMVGRSVDGMIEVNVDFVQPAPAIGA